ncbi:uncharacterized protein EURHEDRAFT_378210 [Aspergillus ruber CBS 135680]|uniref:Uncharacterized protein n=1 Tax=Aspergillus ruber (strain CBS 135680) TaxID=1388766 RepID=A0A017SDN6_ASPRC|nr:uncharacterized protein EURHEDRAFT_378210 [Aspergillus ruber CBS 135680]EYE94759.1 hypothetical protein EURHEDRAFT_378210 [Aspergillus ruber CBS 135680]
MAVSTVRRVLGSISKSQRFDLIRTMLQTLFCLLRIVISFLLLPLDNAVLLGTYFGHYLTLLRLAVHRRRQAIPRETEFRRKTVLIAGVNSLHGLAVARRWYYEGHRVIGADMMDSPVRSGESMSKSLSAFYNVDKTQYVSQLVDIVHKEKVDVWIPCLEQVDTMDDAVAKNVIESRTECRCVQLDPELASRLGSPESLRQYLVERDLPVVENHQVQSRDSVHKILHRSPSKAYLMRKARGQDSRPVMLPQRTLSMTYHEVSEIQINKDNPWILQQQTRLGEFIAEILVVRGQVKAIKVRPGDLQSAWGASRLDQGLAISIHRLMDRFAMKGGSRLTGHLAVHLMVDEEFDANSVRHVLHIAHCTQGAASVKTLLQGPSSDIVSGYLSVLTSQATEASGQLSETPFDDVKSTIAATDRAKESSANTLKKILSPTFLIRQAKEAAWEICHVPFWKDPRFSYSDPFPWWWHTHVYTPLREIGVALYRTPLKD